MVVKKEKLARDSEVARHRPIELITENGFSLVRAADLGDPTPPASASYIFLVRDPDWYELEITVSIDQEFANEITWRSRGCISAESTYWICCAERHLAEYLWENNDYPPGENLIVTQLTPADCDLAIRWGKNDSNQIT